MFKFTQRLPEGGHLIGLGFEEGNLVKLKQGMPIRILYSDLKLPWPGGMLVVYNSPEMDKLVERLVDNFHIIKLDDESLANLRAGKLIEIHFDMKQIDGSDGGTFLLFWGKDNAAIKEMMSPMIGPKTQDASPQIDDGQHRASTVPDAT